jgi:hypothetical protein
MAGMHRDKCGAATVAGFFKVTSMYINVLWDNYNYLKWSP